MSEEWAIALLSFALTVMTTVLGWVATEMLEKLEDKVSENSEKLAAIEQYHTMINVPILKK